MFEIWSRKRTGSGRGSGEVAGVRIVVGREKEQQENRIRKRSKIRSRSGSSRRNITGPGR